MDWSSYIAPVLVPAAVSGGIALVGLYVNRSTTIGVNKEKITADIDLAERGLFLKKTSRNNVSPMTGSKLFFGAALSWPNRF